MTASTDTPTTLALSIDERWSVHSALVADIESADRDDPVPVVAARLLDRVEDGRYEFTAGELDYLEAELSARLDRGAAPDRDRAASRSVLAKLDDERPVVADPERDQG
ncbi:hypothetical protein [Halobacterium yunchengense]|uniref:DUF7853 family protein n=1 Tax=Halobacterium yunchengense TaxID=3108497 RepID=UPI00300A4476